MGVFALLHFLQIDTGIVIMPDMSKNYKEYLVGALVALLVAFIGYLGKDNFAVPRAFIKKIFRILAMGRRKHRDCEKRIRALEKQVSELRSENENIRTNYEMLLTVLSSDGDPDKLRKLILKKAEEIINVLES